MDQVKQVIHYKCNDSIKNKYLGKGIGVAVLDTGLSPHPDLKGRVRAFKDSISGKNVCYDDNGHGTHVAGILAGDGRMSRGVLAGMAPEAHLAIVKVLNQKGEGDIDNIADGLKWVGNNWKRHGIRIVNISAGAKIGLDPRKEEQLIEAVEELWDKGLVVVVSAGNYGPGAGTIAVPGTSRKVITVGAVKTAKPSGHQKSDAGCSGQGPTKACVIKPDVIAPGYHIISCNSITRARREPYTVKSGSSMATPIVSGAVAMLLSKYPDMSNVEVKLRLRETCRRIPIDTEQGWGLLQVDQFLTD